jgi:hypothetical protein
LRWGRDVHLRVTIWCIAQIGFVLKPSFECVPLVILQFWVVRGSAKIAFFQIEQGVNCTHLFRDFSSVSTGDGLMSPSKQLQANRANAHRSTGPRTELGKARSRRNALKHGLSAEKLLIDGEDEAQLNELRVAFTEQFDPKTPAEAEQIERLAVLKLRQRRVAVFEAAILKTRTAQAADEAFLDEAFRRNHGFEVDPEAEATLHLGNALIADAEWDALGRLTRHETNLMNAFLKELQILFMLQADRKRRERERLTIEAPEPANDK